MRTPITITQILLSATLAGCPARTVDGVTNPGEDHELDKNKGHAIVYDARGRGAYVAFQPRQEDAAATSLMRVCAEPPPDVAANLEAESSVKQTIDAALKLKSVEAALGSSTETNASATSTIADAATRTELVLLMRDALYRICEMQMNGTMDASQARASFESVLSTMRNLGQRGNVALLIDALRFIVESKEPKALEQIPTLLALISDLAVLDVGLAAENGVIEAAATKSLLDHLKISVDEAKRIQQELAQPEPVPPTPPVKPKGKKGESK